MEIIKADTRKSTSLLKKLLKDTFNIKTSVRSDFYSMGCSLRIEYALGADQKEVKAIASKLQDSGFDGMTDSKFSIDNEGLIVDGFELENFDYVFVNQTIPTTLKYKLAKMVSDTISFEGVPALTKEEDLNASFGSRQFGVWNWGELINWIFEKRNFATQIEEKIILKSVHYSETSNGKVYFLYEVDGVEYSTEVLPGAEYAATENVSIEEPAAEIEIVQGEVNIIDYSEKAIAVIGDTKPIKDKLKELGGKWNNKLSCGPGWIFSKKRMEEVVNALNTK